MSHMLMMITLVLSLLSPTAHAKLSMRKVDSCKAPTEASDKKVWVIKQWHLAPTNITKGFREKYPQERNQTAIYQQLNNEIKGKRVQLVVAEGCEGEINSDFTTSFNGWDLGSLAKQSQTKGFDRIITSVPLKLEARHGERILTLCGDNLKGIQEGNLRLSNLRGWAGFWSRLQESPDPERLKLYTDSATELLKVPKDTPIAEIQKQIKQKMREELDQFLKSLSERNQSFVNTLTNANFKTAAVVIGGLHAKDLKEKLEAAGLPCEIYEPPGYQRDSEGLIQQFEKSIQ